MQANSLSLLAYVSKMHQNWESAMFWRKKIKNFLAKGFSTKDLKITARLRVQCVQDKALYKSTFTLPYLTPCRSAPETACNHNCFGFTALHEMQTRSSDENSVRPSVTSSVCHRRALWQNGRKICPEFFLPYERLFSLVFWEEERLVRGDPSTWNFGSTGPRWSEIADFEPIIARSASAVTPSDKSSIYINRKSTTCFPMSLRRSSYVAHKPPKASSKTQNGRFPSKIALRLKKVCYNVSLCKNC